jgi:outer membrane protein OmpA-like peptidoglycan-associated protein
MPLSFSVEVLPPLQIRMAPGSLDVASRKVAVTLDRPSSRVEVTVRGPKGVELGGAVTPSRVAAGTPIEVQWSQTAGEVMKLLVRGYDADGFYSDIELSPWRYSVHHEDVVFATNSSVIDGTEEPKLQAAMSDVQGVLDKYGTDVVIKLYIGGHTDTVGDPAHNQTLSLDRAKAIANWFKRAGFKGDIFYQGFGERDLAVATADSVDEVKNRRVTYVLAAQSPEMPKDASDVSWMLLH